MGFFKRKHIFSLTVFPKGQATMEYILLLVLVISIALSIGGPLGNYLKGFSGALIGPKRSDGRLSYYGCLTKAGRLPGDPEAIHCGADLNQTIGGLPPISGSVGPGVGPGGPGIGPGIGPGDDSEGDSEGTDSSVSGADKKNSRNKKSSRHKAGKNTSSAAGTGTGSGQSLSEDNFEGQSTFPVNLKNNKKKSKSRKKKRKKRAKRGGKGLEGDQLETKKKSKKKSSRMRASTGEGYLGEQIIFLEEEEENKPVFKAKDQDGVGSAGVSEEQKNKKLVQEKKKSGDIELEDEDQGIDFSGFLKYFVIVALLIAVIMIVFSQIMEYQSRD